MLRHLHALMIALVLCLPGTAQGAAAWRFSDKNGVCTAIGFSNSLVGLALSGKVRSEKYGVLVISPKDNLTDFFKLHDNTTLTFTFNGGTRLVLPAVIISKEAMGISGEHGPLIDLLRRKDSLIIAVGPEEYPIGRYSLSGSRVAIDKLFSCLER